MNAKIFEQRRSQIKQSFVSLCHDSGLLTVDDIETVFHDDLIESAILDSMGIVCLQDLIESHYQISIGQEQFVADLHTLDKLISYLAVNTTLEAAA